MSGSGNATVAEAQAQHESGPSAWMVRPLSAIDHDGWMSLWQGYQAFYRVDIADAVSRKTWNRLLDPAEPMFGAASVDGAVRAVGLVHWILHRSTWTDGDYCYLQDLFVAPWARGRGVGRGLIEHVYRTAKAAGCPRVHWLTHETNRAAMLLYDGISERSGFVQYRRLLD
jgi:ribosomal protein S18 acetylase RimI-like enzyme